MFNLNLPYVMMWDNSPKMVSKYEKGRQKLVLTTFEPKKWSAVLTLSGVVPSRLA
jgi:hypothetical protein